MIGELVLGSEDSVITVINSNSNYLATVNVGYSIIPTVSQMIGELVLGSEDSVIPYFAEGIEYLDLFGDDLISPVVGGSVNIFAIIDSKLYVLIGSIWTDITDHIYVKTVSGWEQAFLRTYQPGNIWQ